MTENYRPVAGRHAIPGNDSGARENRALQLVPPLVGQALAIELAHRPATLGASQAGIVAPFAAADAEPLIRRVDRRSPDQRGFRENHVPRRQIPGRQQMSSEIGIAIYPPSATRGPVTRPVLRLMRFAAVKLAFAVAAFQRGVFMAHRARTMLPFRLHGELIPEINTIDLISDLVFELEVSQVRDLS